MQRILTSALGAFALIWPGAAATAREALRLQPSASWIIDYADDSCRLAREFGQGDDKSILILSQFGPGDWFKVTFVGKPVQPRSSNRPFKGRLRFGPQEQDEEIVAMPAKVGTLPALLLSGSYRLVPLTAAEIEASRIAGDRVDYQPASSDVSRERAVTWVELARVLTRDLILETGPMDKPMAALRECSWDTVRSWGLDVDQQKSRSRRPAAKDPPSRWIRSADYPAEMVRGGYQGIVHFRIMVDEQGRPTSCHIQASTTPTAFDEVVCRSVMKRATFDPALDADGKPMRSYWVQTVVFRM